MICARFIAKSPRRLARLDTGKCKASLRKVEIRTVAPPAKTKPPPRFRSGGLSIAEISDVALL